MDIFGIIAIAFALAMDAFAVSLGVGTNGSKLDCRSMLRLAFHFGIFQGLMTFLGWLAGSTISRWIYQLDHWIAFGLLVFVGANMIRSGFDHEAEMYKNNPTKGGLMVMLSVATSIDALAVGLSFAFIQTPILLSVFVIAIVAFILTLVGLFSGYRLGQKFGKRMEIVGGVVLIGIGLRILLSHLGIIQA